MNILFYYSSSIDPIHGGIQRVTSFLGDKLEREGIKCFYLSAKNTSDNYLSNQYYFPNQQKRDTPENKIFYINFIRYNSIDIVINQSGITPSHKEIINWTYDLNVKLITVIHNSLFGMYGAPEHIKMKNPFIAYLGNILLRNMFRIKYGKEYQNMAIKSDKIITLSDKFYNEIFFYCRKKNVEKKLSYIYNPITIESKKSCVKEKIILFVGRLEHQKRLDLLLEIWNELFKKYLDWRLIIVGDGSERKNIEHIIRKKKLQRVEIEGYQDPAQYYEKASIFCMTSSYEGFGLVLVEAMVHGVVPFAFNSYASVSDIIDNENNGFLIAPFDIKNYADKISTLIDDENLRYEMSKKACLSSEKFCIHNVVKDWINLLKDVLND